MTEGKISPHLVVMSDADFIYFKDSILEHAGIVLGESKKPLVQGRLSKRLEALNLDDFTVYRKLLENDPKGQEIPHFINALTTNTTFLFREAYHFDHLRDVVEKEIKAAKGKPRTLMIWSAGCSAGDEPYSIALVLKSLLKGHYGWTVKILATDIDVDIINRAERGFYTDEQISKVPKIYSEGNFVPVQGGFEMRQDLKNMIHFKQLNLLHQNWPMKQLYDMIFCRNVTIYFSRPVQSQLVQRFYRLLKPEGYLYMGHSETLMGMDDMFATLGKTVYQRKAS